METSYPGSAGDHGRVSARRRSREEADDPLAIGDGRIYLRTKSVLYAFGVR
jgi:hypothetical protein